MPSTAKNSAARQQKHRWQAATLWDQVSLGVMAEASREHAKKTQRDVK